MPTGKPEQLSEAERTAAVQRAITACSRCPTSIWPELAAHMKEPGVALMTGLALRGYPESEWAAVVQRTHELSKMLAKILTDVSSNDSKKEVPS